MRKTRPVAAARTIHLDSRGVAIVIQVSGKAQITVHFAPLQKAQPPKRSERARV
jgi:hypothetical protein